MTKKPMSKKDKRLRQDLENAVNEEAADLATPTDGSAGLTAASEPRAENPTREPKRNEQLEPPIDGS